MSGAHEVEDLMDFEPDKIPKTNPEHTYGYTMVTIASPVNDRNPKYAGTFRIEDIDGAEGRILLKRSMRKAVASYEEAYKTGKMVPVVVWSDDGLARPYTRQDKERFEQGK